MNTLEMIGRLEKVAFTHEQAIAVAEMIKERHDTVATKEDLKALQINLENKLHTLQVNLDNKIQTLQVNFEDKLQTSQINLENKLQTLQVNGDHKIEAMTHKMEANIYKTRYDLIKWIVGGIIANGLVAALLKFIA